MDYLSDIRGVFLPAQFRATVFTTYCQTRPKSGSCAVVATVRSLNYFGIWCDREKSLRRETNIKHKVVEYLIDVPVISSTKLHRLHDIQGETFTVKGIKTVCQFEGTYGFNAFLQTINLF